jgi:hypothetical protein
MAPNAVRVAQTMVADIAGRFLRHASRDSPDETGNRVPDSSVPYAVGDLNVLNSFAEADHLMLF